MTRFAAVALVLAASPAAAQPAFAQPTGSYYVAVPVSQSGKAQLITRDTPWSLQSGAYVASRAPERDAVLCQLVARNVGALQSFTAGGKAFGADALAACNAHAK